jgi:hypothetical protein
MREMSERAPLTDASYRRFESLHEYEGLIDEFIVRAETVIRVFDRALSTQYNSSRRCDLLSAFLKASPSNRLLIVVHDARYMDRDSPRLVRLAIQHSHAVKIRQTLSAAKQASDAFVIIDTLHYLRRFHQDHMRAGVGTHDGIGAQPLVERFEEIWAASSPAKIGTRTGF